LEEFRIIDMLGDFRYFRPGFVEKTEGAALEVLMERGLQTVSKEETGKAVSS